MSHAGPLKADPVALSRLTVSATRLLSAFMRASVSVGRINSFIQDTEQLDHHPRSFVGQASDSKSAVQISSANFRFSRYGSTGFNLQVEDLKLPRNTTTIVAGDVGSGKSALLLALLGEMHLRSGQVEILTEGGERPKVSYAAQSPWLQGTIDFMGQESPRKCSRLLCLISDTSIRNNILFGEAFDEERYNDTVFACALENDIEGLPEGDETRCGEKGLSLSGLVIHHRPCIYAPSLDLTRLYFRQS